MKTLNNYLPILFAATLLTLCGKIAWDWLKGRKSEVPHAMNGFLSLGEMEARCKTQQETCTALMRAEFQIIKTSITARLDRGDKNFKAYEKRFDGIEQTLKTHCEILKGVQASVTEIARNGRRDGPVHNHRGPGPDRDPA